jgi:hypothetical protein
MSRQYTDEELRDEFLEAVRSIVRYWQNEVRTDRNGAVEGVAFSILNLLDGCSSMPAFDLVCRPHEDDKDYHIENGDNWIGDGQTISDMLHEMFYQK